MPLDAPVTKATLPSQTRTLARRAAWRGSAGRRAVPGAASPETRQGRVERACLARAERGHDPGQDAGPTTSGGLFLVRDAAPFRESFSTILGAESTRSG